MNIFKALEGRHTAFCVGFFVMGNVMHFMHRLDATYLSFLGILMGFVLGHATQENYFSKSDNTPPSQ